MCAYRLKVASTPMISCISASRHFLSFWCQSHTHFCKSAWSSRLSRPSSSKIWLRDRDVLLQCDKLPSLRVSVGKPGLLRWHVKLSKVAAEVIEDSTEGNFLPRLCRHYIPVFVQVWGFFSVWGGVREIQAKGHHNTVTYWLTASRTTGLTSRMPSNGSGTWLPRNSAWPSEFSQLLPI
jgi:hypothetical protein